MSIHTYLQANYLNLEGKLYRKLLQDKEEYKQETILETIKQETPIGQGKIQIGNSSRNYEIGNFPSQINKILK